MGSNMAENHPVAFRWVMKAKEKGATLIHVDPRFTRTSAVADIYAPIRTGSDIAFLGGYDNSPWQSRGGPVGEQARAAATAQSGEQPARPVRLASRERSSSQPL